MTKLLLVITPSPSSIKEALKKKIMLQKIGMNIHGVAIHKRHSYKVPMECIEDMLKLKIFFYSN